MSINSLPRYSCRCLSPHRDSHHCYLPALPPWVHQNRQESACLQHRHRCEGIHRHRNVRRGSHSHRHDVSRPLYTVHGRSRPPLLCRPSRRRTRLWGLSNWDFLVLPLSTTINRYLEDQARTDRNKPPISTVYQWRTALRNLLIVCWMIGSSVIVCIEARVGGVCFFGKSVEIENNEFGGCAWDGGRWC